VFNFQPVAQKMANEFGRHFSGCNLQMRSSETPHQTHKPLKTTASNSGISGGGFPKCPDHTGHADALSQKGIDLG